MVTRELSKLFNNKIFVIGELRVREDFKKVQICDTCQKSRGEVQTKTIFYKIWEIWTKILREVGEIILCHKSVTKYFVFLSGFETVKLLPYNIIFTF